MNKEEITEKLLRNHELLVQTLRDMPGEILNRSNDSKWTPAQHFDHISRSINPLGILFKLPKWLVRFRFGMSNRDSRDYDAVAEKYRARLKAGGRAAGRFLPDQKPFEKTRLVQKGERAVEKLSRSFSRWSEREMDVFIIPHPLLGKLTVREMLYFTIYHIEHHRKLIQRDYGTSLSN
jgi:hypothetical protein